MKKLITLILTGLALAICYLQEIYIDSYWMILLLPLLLLKLHWEGFLNEHALNTKRNRNGQHIKKDC
jgi:hypothetical protein